jgi:hypothetical protein
VAIGGKLDIMAEADCADASVRPGWRWDVALSFAGAQRDYVEKVAQALKARGVRCFYDADEQVRLWGTHVAEELPRIYLQESAAVVVFISADYAGRDWTRLERRAAFSRAVAEAGAYVLPARFDDSELPRLLPDVVTIHLRRCSVLRQRGQLRRRRALVTSAGVRLGRQTANWGVATGSGVQGTELEEMHRFLRRERGRGLAHNGTATGDSELNPAALPPTVVRMWVGHGRIDL